MAAASPDKQIGDSLYTFLAARYFKSWVATNCDDYTGVAPELMVMLTMKDGVTVNATYVLTPE